MKDLEKSITALKNGTKVANFSSPHIYTFEDGSKLAKCDIREAGLFKVHFREKVVKDIRDIAGIEMDFMLSKALLSRMNMWEQLYNEKKVDVVFCSLPLLTAIKKVIAPRGCIRIYGYVDWDSEIPTKLNDSDIITTPIKETAIGTS